MRPSKEILNGASSDMLRLSLGISHFRSPSCGFHSIFLTDPKARTPELRSLGPQFTTTPKLRSRSFHTKLSPQGEIPT